MPSPELLSPRCGSATAAMWACTYLRSALARPAGSPRLKSHDRKPRLLFVPCRALLGFLLPREDIRSRAVCLGRPASQRRCAASGRAYWARSCAAARARQTVSFREVPRQGARALARDRGRRVESQSALVDRPCAWAQSLLQRRKLSVPVSIFAGRPACVRAKSLEDLQQALFRHLLFSLKKAACPHALIRTNKRKYFAKKNVTKHVDQ